MRERLERTYILWGGTVLVLASARDGEVVYCSATGLGENDGLVSEDSNIVLLSMSSNHYARALRSHLRPANHWHCKETQRELVVRTQSSTHLGGCELGCKVRLGVWTTIDPSARRLKVGEKSSLMVGVCVFDIGPHVPQSGNSWTGLNTAPDASMSRVDGRSGCVCMMFSHHVRCGFGMSGTANPLGDVWAIAFIFNSCLQSFRPFELCVGFELSTHLRLPGMSRFLIPATPQACLSPFKV